MSTIDAQVCKIIGTTGDTVEVFRSSYSDGEIKVVLSNDSPTAANVQVTVSVTYSYFNYVETITYSGKVLAQPLGSSEVSIAVPETINKRGAEYKFSSYSIISVTGNKCDN